MVGARGDCEIFSLHATKVIGVDEGGVISARNRAVTERIDRLKNFGFDAAHNAREVGTNAKFSEIASAIGLRQLEALPERLVRRREVLRLYADALRLLGVEFQLGMERAAPPFVSAALPKPGCGDLVGHALEQAGVGWRAYFNPPVHRQQSFEGARSVGDLAATDDIASCVISLPSLAWSRRRFLVDRSPEHEPRHDESSTSAAVPSVYSEWTDPVVALRDALRQDSTSDKEARGAWTAWLRERGVAPSWPRRLSVGDPRAGEVVVSEHAYEYPAALPQGYGEITDPHRDTSLLLRSEGAHYWRVSNRTVVGEAMIQVRGSTAVSVTSSGHGLAVVGGTDVRPPGQNPYERKQRSFVVNPELLRSRAAASSRWERAEPDEPFEHGARVSCRRIRPGPDPDPLASEAPGTVV